jgi:hypothetical protein
MGKKLLLSGSAFLLFLVGCQTDTDQVLSSDRPDEKLVLAPRIRLPTNYFSSYTEAQSDSHPVTERFVDCPIDYVMTGVGGWVHAGDFQGVTVHCKAINADGSLGTEVALVNGSPGEESVVTASPGWVVTGVGGWVGNNDFKRALILQCPWIPANKSVASNSCFWKGSDGDPTGELLYSVRATVTNGLWPKTIATGAGFTASDDNVSEIRLTIGTLK